MRADWVSAGVLLLVLLTALVFLVAAFLLWRHGYLRGWRAARKGPPICIKCGYNLSGLTRCRCPECGTEYRLEELWRGRAVAPRNRRQKTGAAVEPQESRDV